jgi:hypothetical protein
MAGWKKINKYEVLFNMIICRTLDEVNQQIPLSPITQVGHASFRKKPLNGFHQGHMDLLTYARANCDMLLVSLSDTHLFVKALTYCDAIAPINYDEEYCITFMENNNVDLLFIHSPGVVADFIQDINLFDLRKQALQLIIDEGWEMGQGHIQNSTNWNALYSEIMSDMIYTTNNIYRRRNRRFTTWKDGLRMVYYKYYADKYSATKTHLLSPSFNNGIPYSTKYNNASQKLKDFISQGITLLGQTDLTIPKTTLISNVQTNFDNVRGQLIGGENIWFDIEVQENDKVIGLNKRFLNLTIGDEDRENAMPIPLWFDL